VRTLASTTAIVIACAACALHPVSASRAGRSRPATPGVHAGLFVQPGTVTDPVERYLSSLPTTNASFPALLAADAQTWKSFFDALPGAVARLTVAVRDLDTEFKRVDARFKDTGQRAKTAVAKTEKATAELNAATNALLRAKARAGAASVDTQKEEDRVERAARAREQASTEQEVLLEALGRLERERSQKQVDLSEGRTALERATARIGPPQLGAIANRELKIGNQIVVVKNHTDVSDAIGIAECEGTAPIILLAPRPVQAISNAAMMFFREHEMAHHVLGHIDCSRGQTVRTGGPEQEIQADCEAEKTLIQFQDGQRVVDIVFGHFWTWNQPGSVTHPSSQSRARALFASCS
jgi:hypothetical protein